MLSRGPTPLGLRRRGDLERSHRQRALFEKHFLDGCVEDEGETPCVGDVHPLVSPIEGVGDLGLGAIARVGDGVFCVDGKHPASGELPISSALSSSEALEDGGDHFVVILEGIVVAPRWSTAFSSIVVVVVWLFGLELLSQTEAVLHLMLAIFVERAWAFEDLLVLLVVVALGVRFINDGDDVV